MIDDKNKMTLKNNSLVKRTDLQIKTLTSRQNKKTIYKNLNPNKNHVRYNSLIIIYLNDVLNENYQIF